MQVARGVRRSAVGVVRSGRAEQRPAQTSEVLYSILVPFSRIQASTAVANFERRAIFGGFDPNGELL